MDAYAGLIAVLAVLAVAVYELKPLKISHRLKEISNKPPGIDKATPILEPKSSKIVPEIKTI